MAEFSLDIYTPNKVIAKDVPASSLKIPTTRGEINVLPDHTHIIAQLDTGILETDEYRFVMTTGIVKVLGRKVTILAQVAEQGSDIDGERAKIALQKAKEKLSGAETLDVEELEKYRRKLARALVRTQISK